MNFKTLPPTIFDFTTRALRPYWPWLSMYVFCAMLSGAYGTALWYLTKIIVENLTEIKSAAHIWDSLFIPFLLFSINFMTHGLSWRGISFAVTKMMPRVSADIVQNAFVYTHHQSYQFFLDNPPGTTSHNVLSLSSQLENSFTMIIPHIIRSGVQVILALSTVYFVHPIFTVILFAWVCIFCSASYFFSKKTRFLASISGETHAKTAGAVVDSLGNAVAVQIFAQQPYEHAILKPFLMNWLMRSQKVRNYQNFVNLSYVAILSVFISLILYTLIILKIQNEVTIGDFSFILGLCLFLSETMIFLTFQIDHLQDSLGKIKQNLSAIYRPFQVLDKSDSQPLVVSEGRIDFENVTFKYTQRSSIFNALNVKIEKQQHVGLVGYSGGGKTTFVHLLLRLYDAEPSQEAGRILVDGQNIQNVTLASLRHSISFVPQDAIMFHRSLRDNIRFAQPDATDEEIEDAAKKARLHDLIMTLPEGYDTLVGERGVRLSGGQRQRVALARAILKNAPIVILDEATSQLDSLTERDIQTALDELTLNKTCIVIAHRLSTLLKMDRILVFHNGEIVEDGTHHDLLHNNGHYSKLWHAQLDGFLPESPDGPSPISS